MRNYEKTISLLDRFLSTCKQNFRLFVKFYFWGVLAILEAIRPIVSRFPRFQGSFDESFFLCICAFTFNDMPRFLLNLLTFRAMVEYLFWPGNEESLPKKEKYILGHRPKREERDWQNSKFLLIIQFGTLQDEGGFTCPKIWYDFCVFFHLSFLKF